MNKPITTMELNEFYMDHKTNIQSTELDLLKSAGFEDSSFYNELCAKFSREYLNIHVCTLVIEEYVGDEDFLSAHFYESNPLHPKNWIDGDRPENLLGAKLDRPFITASSDVYLNGESEILTEDKRMPMNIPEAIIACTKFEEKHSEINKPITIMPLNDVHMDQKVRMNSTELDLLKCAGFGDNSWGDDECPSFHRDSRYNKDHFYEIYVCYVILDGKTKGNYHVRPIITAMYNKEKALLNVDGQDYFHEVSEAIIACVKHDEDANKSAKNKEKNLEEYHKLLSMLTNDQADIFISLQTMHALWCKMHGLEFMCANDMLTVCDLNDYQRKWLKAYSKAWDGMEEIKRFHGFAYNNAGEEL